MSEGTQTLTVLVLLSASAFSVVGLTAIWTALGRGHWFLRAAALAGMLSLLLLLPAHDLFFVFLVQSVFVITPLTLIRRWRSRPSVDSHGGDDGRPIQHGTWLSLSLRDLLLLTGLLTVSFAALSRAPQEVWDDWGNFLMGGVFAATATITAAWLALGRRWLWLRVLAFCIGASLGGGNVIPEYWGWGYSEISNLSPSRDWIMWPGLWSTVALSVLTAAWLSALRLAKQEPKPKRLGRRLALVALGVLSGSMVIPLAVVYYKLVQPPPPIPLVTLPDPNGYDELARIASKVQPNEPDVDTAAPATLRSFVTEHQPLFDDVREALKLDSRVPVRYTQYNVIDDLSFDALHAYSSLARSLVIEGNLAEQDGAMSRAAESYLTIVRLGQTLKYGGLQVDWLVGNAIEAIGLAELIRLRPSLNANECRQLIRELDPLGAQRETPRDVAHRDWIWEQNVSPWYVRLLALLDPDWNTKNWVLPHMEAAQRRRHATRRLLVCDLAIRAYKSDEGSLPPSLDALVGKYLPEMPLDPFTGKPFVYRTTQTGYQLYSLGEDGDDDGGQPAVDNWGPGDFTLP